MERTFVQIAALLTSAAILLMGNALLSTLIPLRAEIEAFSTFHIGIVGSAYYFGFSAGCLFGSQLIRRVGHIRTFAAMVALASAAPLLHNIWISAIFWCLVRMATGFCLAALFMIIESWLNEKSTNENRGIVFSAYTIISMTVVTLGQLMINLADLNSFVLFSVASVLVSLAAVPLSLTRASAPAPVKQVRVRILRLFRLSPVGVVGAFLVGGQHGTFWALGPVFANRIGFDALEISLFMSIAVIGGALGQWPLGKLSDRVDRRYVILGCCVVAALLGLAIRLSYPTIGNGILALTLLWGIVVFPLYAICAAYMNDHVSDDGFVEASSGILLMFAAGAIVGPLVISPFMTLRTPYVLFSGIAFFQIALALFIAYRRISGKAMPLAARSDFVEALNDAQTVAPIEFHDSMSTSDEESRNRESDGVVEK